MATALAEAVVADFPSLERRRDAFEQRLETTIAGMHRIGGALRLPQTSLLRFEGVDSAPLLLRLDDRGFAVSSGSACTAGRTDPSPTLLSMGLSAHQAHGALRVSFGCGTPEDALERLAEVLAEEIPVLRRV
jgi:cysteine desulfurase